MKKEGDFSERAVRNVVCGGCTWTVFEQRVPYGPSRCSLVFMSDRVARRVKQYPANWFELSDSALADISANA
jgi:hypothetical protein